VVAIDGDTLSFDAVSETLDRTTLNQWAEGVAVNLELAVTPSQPLGGHIVQGHVDGVGKLVQVVRDPGDWRITIAPPPQVVDYLVPKGSITVDGVSLTLAAVHDDGRFEIALIPETLERTTLGEAVEGQAVNLEADVLSKTVVHHLRRMQGATTPMAEPVTMDLLREAGFTG
jgi:riboflavin synthase